MTKLVIYPFFSEAVSSEMKQPNREEKDERDSVQQLKA